MRCWRCGAEGASSGKCAHCGADGAARRAAASPEGAAMRRLYDRYGCDAVLGNVAYLTNGLSDLLPENALLRSQMSLAMNAGLGRMYLEQLQLAGQPDPAFQTRVKGVLEHSAGLSESAARQIMGFMDEMIGWSPVGQQSSGGQQSHQQQSGGQQSHQQQSGGQQNGSQKNYQQSGEKRNYQQSSSQQSHQQGGQQGQQQRGGQQNGGQQQSYQQRSGQQSQQQQTSGQQALNSAGQAATPVKKKHPGRALRIIAYVIMAYCIALDSTVENLEQSFFQGTMTVAFFMWVIGGLMWVVSKSKKEQ